MNLKDNNDEEFFYVIIFTEMWQHLDLCSFENCQPLYYKVYKMKNILFIDRLCVIFSGTRRDGINIWKYKFWKV